MPVKHTIEGNKSRVGNMLDYMRSNAVPEKRQRKEFIEEDFVEVPSLKEEEDEDLFFYDNSGSNSEAVDNQSCPPTLAEMMVIVHGIRQQNEAKMTKSRVNNYEEYEED